MNVGKHFLSPKLEVRALPDKGGFGVYALETVAAGEIVSVWGGYIVTAAQLETLSHEVQQHTVQIEEGLYSATIGGAESADFINHSCDPNLGLRGQITLVALRDIEAGEEVCFDYAMTDCTPYDEFECRCGSANCRGTVRGEDWKLPELWAKYAGYFSPYLQRRIDRLAQDQGLVIMPLGVSTPAWSITPRTLVEVPRRRR
ncbi:hypothetical protein TFLX_03400 [Thermoflexales bacterium]|nr:hypothetical protein TFLX_03400 [Thermoflexales bacterium]